MSSGIPIIKQTAWLYTITHVSIMMALIWLAKMGGIKAYIPAGAAVYLVLSMGLRHLIPKNHRKGVALVKKGWFTEALAEFERSFEFFSKHGWIDRWRAVTLLSPSRMSYREMALVNMAFCCCQTGRHGDALKYYQQALEEYPGNQLAECALRMMNASPAEGQLPHQP